jgi:sec-independent protein translocase protein TatA
MFGIGPTEMIIIGIIAVLLFGRRLPEVAKSLGSSYREFRKGLNELQSSVNTHDLYSSSSSSSSSPKSYTESKPVSYGDMDDHTEATAPKFEPPPCEPQSPAPDAPPSGDIAKNIPER